VPPCPEEGLEIGRKKERQKGKREEEEKKTIPEIERESA
jgi:hypothetical protein